MNVLPLQPQQKNRIRTLRMGQEFGGKNTAEGKKVQKLFYIQSKAAAIPGRVVINIYERALLAK